MLQLEGRITVEPAAKLPSKQSKHNARGAEKWRNLRSSHRRRAPCTVPGLCCGQCRGKVGNSENRLQSRKFSQQIKQGTQGCEIVADLKRSDSISFTKLTLVKHGARMKWFKEGLGERKTHRQKTRHKTWSRRGTRD